MKTYEVNGYYGSGKTSCTVFVAETHHLKYYVADGGTIVNLTPDPIENGVNIETLSDVDCFTASKPIESLDELEQAINS